MRCVHLLESLVLLVGEFNCFIYHYSSTELFRLLLCFLPSVL